MKEAKEQVCKLRKRMDMNQETFAEKIGRSVDTIRKIEQGSMKLSADIAIAIADAFHVSLDWLYGRADDTNDDASTMLLYLDKLLGFYVDKNYDFRWLSLFLISLTGIRKQQIFLRRAIFRKQPIIRGLISLNPTSTRP